MTAEDTSAARFHQGTIVAVNAATQRGVLRGASGREIPFRARDVRVQGRTGDFAALRPGMRVGFDVGRTSSGLVVSVIHVPADQDDQSGKEVR